MPRLFTRLASGLAPSVTLGGERGCGMWFPDVFAILLKSLNGKEWQECRDIFCSQAPRWNKLSSTQVCRHQWWQCAGGMMHSRLCLPRFYPRNHPSL